jgi:hypothetical protein
MATTRINAIIIARNAGATEIDATAEMARKHDVANEALFGGKLGLSFIFMEDGIVFHCMRDFSFSPRVSTTREAGLKILGLQPKLFDLLT